MIDAQKLGRLVAEAVLNQGPCFYPGKFKPPHKGHFEAAYSLTRLPYIKVVYIIISNKVVEGITPEDSLTIWKMYLDAKPNPNIQVRIATSESPIQSIYQELKANSDLDPVYVAVGEDEKDDKDYGQSLQADFGDRVKVIKVQEKAGNISAPVVRNMLRNGDYEGFAESVPEAAFNKGAAPKIFKLLAPQMQDETRPENT